MAMLDNLKPAFWYHVGVGGKTDEHPYDFRRIWKLIVVLTLMVALIPLVVISVTDYRVTQKAIQSEIMLRTARLVSNARRSITFFLAERRSALDFINRSMPYSDLVAPGSLELVLENLKASFGGFVDIGVIDTDGRQVAYAGPYDLVDKDYSNAAWFKAVTAEGVYLSDVFQGFRKKPHLVIAVKHRFPDGCCYVLRATLDTTQFNELISGLEVSGEGDAFVVNRSGILQTTSRSHGGVMDPIDINVPAFSEFTQVIESRSAERKLIVGYAYIPQTPFILMVVKDEDRLMVPWRRSRLQIIAFLAISVAAIVLVILGGITYLVNLIYLADKRRLAVIHKVEYANKMASLGRLSAGVAHEINNPLAIINEKAGLIKDLFQFKGEYAKDPKLMSLIDAVIASVDRCAGITRRLLNFARHSDMKTSRINLRDIIHEVLGFVGKEAEYRCITVSVSVAEDIPLLKSDPGRLQEIFLNLITNAFAAVSDCGFLKIAAAMTGSERVSITFQDSGHGIRAEDIDRVFEPFFSTKIGSGGTGLGLSITYTLVQELGGRISVASEVGKGTTFTVVLPLVSPSAERSPASPSPCSDSGGQLS